MCVKPTMVSSPLLAGRDGSFFLETEVGQPYVDVFQAIRLQHILNEVVSTGTLEADRIIPECELSLTIFHAGLLTLLTGLRF